MKENYMTDLTFKFAIRIVNFYKYMTNEQKEFVLSKQILRSGTSIGANVVEAYNGESDADFIHKLSISQKECSETSYWLRLFKASEYIDDRLFNSIHQDCDEVYKIVTSTIISKKKNQKK
jgi:four helix bundle protein